MVVLTVSSGSTEKAITSTSLSRLIPQLLPSDVGVKPGLVKPPSPLVPVSQKWQAFVCFAVLDRVIALSM
jgi:hypothetical protein